MRRALLILLVVVVIGIAVFGGLTARRLSLTRERRAADVSAAAAAVLTANPDLSESQLSTDFWNPSSDTLAVVQVTCSDHERHAYNVTVRWNPVRHDSLPMSVEPNENPK